MNRSAINVNRDVSRRFPESHLFKHDVTTAGEADDSGSSPGGAGGSFVGTVGDDQRVSPTAVFFTSRCQQLPRRRRE